MQQPPFIRPIENTIEAWDRLLQRQIAERYGVPVTQVQVLRDCNGGISVHVDTTKWDEVEGVIQFVRLPHEP